MKFTEDWFLRNTIPENSLTKWHIDGLAGTLAAIECNIFHSTKQFAKSEKLSEFKVLDISQSSKPSRN